MKYAPVTCLPIDIYTHTHNHTYTHPTLTTNPHIITLPGLIMPFSYRMTLPILTTKRGLSIFLQSRHSIFLGGGHEESAAQTLRGSCHICKRPYRHCCELPVRLSCGHIFGNFCLASWIRQVNGLRPCPLCFETMVCYVEDKTVEDGITKSHL